MYNQVNDVSKKINIQGNSAKKCKCIKKCNQVGRTILLVSNSILMIVGTAILCVGFLVVSKAPQVSKTDKIHIFIGVCDTSLGVLGLTATIKRNYLIILFVAMTVMLIPLHIGFGIESLLKINDERYYEISIKMALVSIYKSADSDIEAAYNMGMIQYYFKCCGINGHEDYESYKPYLPRSCCENHPTYCETNNPHVFKNGCQNPVVKFTLLKRKITGIILLLLLIPLFSVGFLGVGLSERIRKITQYLH